MRLLLFLSLPGCLFIDQQELDARIDADADGFIDASIGGDDCDDNDAAIHPGASDPYYDGVDSNCDGADDSDADRDGLRALAAGGTDCDDTRASVGAEPQQWSPDCDGDGVPSAVIIEECGVPTDNPCAGGAPQQWLRPADMPDCDDEDPRISPLIIDTPYDGVDSDCGGGDDFDADGDGVPLDLDCDDTRPDVLPGAAEVWYDGVDQDCDGASDFDADHDGFDNNIDCDDNDASIHPGAHEIFYDGIDQDCDGASDFDADQDGFTTVSAPYDCDDTDPSIHPGAHELYYDGIDQDCDGANDFDADHDGYVELLTQIGGTATESGDCDDHNASIHPGIVEVYYDGVDADCAGDNDFDADHDGFVQIGAESEAGGTAPLLGDCDDHDPWSNPAAPDTPYDGLDSDCDGGDDFDADGDGSPVGEDCDDTDPSRAPGLSDPPYDGIDSNCDGADDYDVDGDGVRVDLDCDDNNPHRAPGLPEVYYDGVDSDCDGRNDYDVDGDGYIAAQWTGMEGALQVGDCDDFDPSIHPDLPDHPYDNIDSDCDGANDFDADGDGVVPASYAIFAGGTAPDVGDCNDHDASISPLAVDLWYDGVDSDCDGSNDFDRDRDGVVRAGDDAQAGGSAPGVNDCDDGSPEINPAVIDLPYDGIDSNCDQQDDYDVDRDGHQAAAFGGDDCDDTDPDIHPGMEDLPDTDRNCDGVVFFDTDGDGIADPEDCDSTDPTRWIGGHYSVTPGERIDTLVQAACPLTVFSLEPGVYPVPQTIFIDRPLDFVGQGTLVGEQVQIFNINAQTHLTGLTLRDGDAPSGGCMEISDVLVGVDLLIEDCHAQTGGGMAVTPSGDVTLTSTSFRTNDAINQGGSIYSQGRVELFDSETISSLAAQGGAIFTESYLGLFDSVLNDDHGTDRGGAIFASGELQLRGVQVLSPTADHGAAFYLEDSFGQVEDLSIVNGVAPNVFNEDHAVLFITGGSTGLTLDHTQIHGSTATSGLQIQEHEGPLLIHDLEVGFHVGRHSVSARDDDSTGDLQISNLFVHDQTSVQSSIPVSLYSLLAHRSWSLTNATITRNNGTQQLFVGCHACGSLEVSNVLTGSVTQIGGPTAGLMWIDTFSEILVHHTTTLYDRVFLKAYNGPEQLPPSCTACTQSSIHPFRVELPGSDVHLDPTSILKGTGDPGICASSTAPDCLDPGFWGGPNPPVPR